MKRTTALFAAIIIAGAIGFDADAQADMTSFVVATNPPQQTTDFTETLTVPVFNKSLGTLTSIVLDYKVTSTINGSVTNYAPISENFSVTEATAYTLSYNSASLMTNALSATQSYTELAGNGGTANFGQFTPSGSPAHPASYTTGSLFNAFNGSGNDVIFSFSTLTDTKVSGGGGNITTGIYTDAGAVLTVDYYYTAAVGVPEPASIGMTMLGGMFLGSCWLVKRRRSVKSVA